MWFLVALGGLSMFATVTAQCGTPPPTDGLRALHVEYSELAGASKKAREEPLSRITIVTYCHIISMGHSSSEGNLTQKVIEDQNMVLNQRYNPHGFAFQLNGTTRNINKDWNNQALGSPGELAFKTELRRGSYKDLNIYFTKIAHDHNGDSTLGYATFPATTLSAQVLQLDGVVLDPQVSPGNDSFAPFIDGMTAVHEIGHWLSLLHTFEAGNGHDGCVGNGDLIADTPAERSAASVCPQGRNTCTGENAEGYDPIHNYMDYADDSCMTTFTPDQVTRMRSIYVQLRDVSTKTTANGNGL